MSKYDVIVVGGGPGGLFNAAILAKSGKKVLLLEKSDQVGGRAAEWEYKGHRINLSWHQMEETGAGVTKIVEYAGKELRHSPASLSIPVYRNGRWTSQQDIIGKDSRADWKAIVNEIVNMSWDAIDKLDDQPIRPWIQQRTQSEGILFVYEVMALFEGMTYDWRDHSLSETLWMRKEHYTERRMSAYCYNPVGGWQQIWDNLADSIRENDGEIRLSAPVMDILIENDRARGVEVLKRPYFMATDLPDSEIIEAPCVISTVPCWNVLDIVDEKLLPSWYVDLIRFISRDELRVTFLGLYAALPKPFSGVAYPQEMPAWLKGLRTGLFGMCVDLSAFDPSLSPPNEHLFSAWSCISHEHLKLPRQKFNQLVSDFEKEIEDLFPEFKNRLWTERHYGFDPTYTVIWKAGAVGRYMPDVEVPCVEGLFFAGEGFRGRSIGCDRPARRAMTVTEKVLGRPIAEFKNSWHY